jgi:ACS family hexuronate transporter-like MFS transporter
MPPPSQGHIFLCYRREDSADITGRFFDRLVQHFGREAIFKDVDSIPLGVDFRSHIDATIKGCRVVIVVIGDRWLSATATDGQRRLEKGLDHVRIEIQSALARDIPIIPLLVRDSEMPSPESLPEPLQDLAYRNGATVRSDPHFHSDVSFVISHLEKMLDVPPPVIAPRDVPPAAVLPEEKAFAREAPAERPESSAPSPAPSPPISAPPAARETVRPESLPQKQTIPVSVPSPERAMSRAEPDRCQKERTIPAPLPPEARSQAWRWWIAGLLLLVAVVRQMDLGLSKREFELRLTSGELAAFGLLCECCFAVGCIFFGLLADRLRVYFLYPAIAIAWALAGVATASGHGYEPLLLRRALLSFFAAGHLPCALKTTFALFTGKNRMMGNSILQCGFALGPAIVSAMAMPMTATNDRIAVIVAAGSVWVALWFGCVRRRDFQSTAAAGTPSEPAGFRAIVRGRRFWGLALLVIACEPIASFYSLWLARHLKITGFASSSIQTYWTSYFSAGAFGCILAGAISLWLIRRREVPAHAAQLRVCALACCCTSLSVFLPALGGAPVVLLLFIGAGAFALYPCWFSFTQELSARYLGRIAGLLALVATFTRMAFVFVQPHSSNWSTVLVGLMPWIGLIAMKLLWKPEANGS